MCKRRPLQQVARASSREMSSKRPRGLFVSARPRLDAEDPGTADQESSTVEGLLQKGCRVFFHADVERRSVLALLDHLEEATKHAVLHDHPCVWLFLHSSGGDAFAGLSAMDHIRANRVPVHTVADGFVASAATFMLLAGAKRYAMPHATVLIHQVSTGFWDKYVYMKDEMHNAEQLMNVLKSIYTSSTKLTTRVVEDLLKKELTMTADECVRNGMVDALFARGVGTP